MKKDRTFWIAPLALLLAAPLLLLLVFGRSLAVSDGRAAGNLCGFGVDSEENIYVATEKKIKVYRDGTRIRMFDPPPSRAYALYLDDDCLIIGLAGEGKGGVYDLEGNELSFGGYDYTEIAQRAKEKTVVVNGHEYRLNASFGQSPYFVTRDGEVVARAESTFFEGLPYWTCLAVLLLSFLVLVFVFLSEMMSERDKAP